jgi:hypothetical protein
MHSPASENGPNRLGARKGKNDVYSVGNMNISKIIK